MKIDAYRDLQLLTELSSGQSVTQRSLAQKQGLALGLTNLLIRRLVRKGYVKIINLTRNRIRYLLTPRGLAEKARLTYQYLEYSLYFYRQIRTFLTHALAGVQQSDAKNILLFGRGEVAEIAFLVCQQSGLNVTAVVDQDASPGDRFMNQPIKRLEELPTVTFDRVVVASLKDRQQIVQLLCEWGVAKDQIIVIPDEQTPEFRAGKAAIIPDAPLALVSEGQPQA